MPLYSYKCQCDKVFNDIFVSYKQRLKEKCPCGERMQILPCAPKVHTFRGGEFEHIAEDPVHIDTPAQLHEACRANNCYSPYLLDSPFKRKLSSREI